MHALGAGPAPLPPRRLTVDALAAAIRDVVDNQHYSAADGLTRHVAAEDSVTPVSRALEYVRPA